MTRDLSRRLRASAVSSAVLVAAMAASAPAHALNPMGTSVQMFEWGWNDIATECTQWLGPQGYDGVQISPPGASKKANGWWDAYQPVNYASLTSRFGNASQLQSMISACHAAGVRVYADIVVNQMADGSSATNGVATDGSSWDASSLSYPYFSGNDFHAYCNIQSSDYNSPSGQWNVQNCRLGGLPDLNTESSYVQGQIVNYLNTLLSMGVDGFRFDAAKHIATSSINAILTTVKSSHPKTNLGENIWVTQEIIPDGEVTRSDYFQNGTINEFNYPYAMRDAWRNYNGSSPSTIPSMMGTWGNWGGSWGFVQPQNATVFINNWDTERNGSTLDASNYTGSEPNDTQGSHRYDLASIFMLAQGYGEAQLHSGYRFTDTNADRPTASPYDASGNPQINVNWDFIHRWSDISNMVKFRAAALGQPIANWTTGNANQIAFSRGNVGFVALNNTTGSWSNTFYTGLPAGTYCNVAHGLATSSGCASDSVTVNSSGYATITVPADGGSTVPAVAIYTGQLAGGSSGGGSGGGGGSTTCAVTFTISNANTTYGQNLYVVGNTTNLGNWTPSQGFALTIQGSGANVPWSGTVNLPASTAVQYKYVKWDGSTAVWESNQSTSSGNREFTTCAAGSSVSRNDGNFKF